MANRKPPSKNVIYDSINDTGSGRKRAVEFTGGVSVAERARLFGAQVNHTTVSKPTKPDNQNQQRIRTNSSDQNYSYSSTEQRPPNNHRSAPPPQNYDRPNRNEPPPSSSNRYRSESPSQNYDRPSRHHQQQRPPPPPSSSIQSQDYSTVNRSQRQPQPKATYQSVVYSTAQRQNHSKPSHTSVPPGESFTTDDEIYYESQRRQQRRQQKQQQQRHISPPSYNSNYFQPIRDPLEVLYTQPSFGYSQPSLSTNTSQSTEGLQPFDLGNLIGRIQQDYIDNARPYVSSIQFIDSPQTSSTLGLNSSTGNQTNNNLYLRPGAAYQYDVIDTSKFIPTYVKPVPGQYQHRRHHHHGSSRRRQHRGHYRDRASSPIDVMEKEKTPSPPPKPSTPIEEKPETPEETEEDETVNTKTEEKTAEDGTSEEEEDEDEEEEEEKKPAPVVPPVTASIANPRPPPVTEQNDSSSSESEETESDSDSDSDDSDDSGKKKKKKKVISKPPLPPTPAPAPAATSARTNVRATPQLNSRGAAVEPGTPVLKKITNNNTDDPPEVSTSTKSFNTQEQEKSGIRGKFSALASKFRRKKS